MKTIIHLFLFFVLFFKSVQNIVECDRVRHNLDLLLQTFNDSTRDNNEHVLSSICSENSIQCCSAREQHVLKTRSARDFSSLIGSICHPISEKIQTIESQLKSILKQILNKSFLSQKFEKFLPDLWDIIVPNARDSDGRPARDAIEQHVNRFFDLLFVAEYEKQKRKEFSGEFATCLSTLWTEYNAFGHVPQTMSFQLQRAADSYSLLLRSLSIAREVIHLTQNYAPNDRCLEALMRATYCSQCAGHVSVRPCRRLCDHVIRRDCLPEPFNLLDKLWTKFVFTWKHFSSSLVSDRNPETVFMSRESLIEEGIHLFHAKTHETAKKVRVACGHPKRYLRNASAPPSSTVMTTSSASTSTSMDSSESFYVRLQTFAHQLSETKDFYSSLSEMICNEYKDDNNCWNGNSIGQYSEPLITFTEQTKKFENSSKIELLAEKLKKMIKIMDSYVSSSHISPHSSSSEEYLMDSEHDSSGSGHRDSLIDDEDYVVENGDGSGSGDGDDNGGPDITESTTNRVDDNDITFTDSKAKGQPRDSSAICCPHLFTVLLLLWIVFALKCLSCDL